MQNQSTAHPFTTGAFTKDIVNRFPGGYWKQDLTDHVLLVNLYFPPESFIEEMKEMLPRLMCSYPTPHDGIAKDLGDFLGHHPDRLIVCNGLSEVIPILLGRLSMKIAVPVPSFNPYEFTAGPGNLLRFPLPDTDFELDVDRLGAQVVASDLDAAVVISPNNPTSRAVSREELHRLARYLERHGKRLLVDESFVDFVDDGRRYSFEKELDAFPNVVVLKSMGKVYGTCGLRLGYVVSSDVKLMAAVRSALPVWNVNPLAEFFLTRLPDMQQQAVESWVRIRQDRDALWRELSSIDGMKVLKPEANFVFCRIPDHWPDGVDIARRMLSDHKILIRHNGGKTLPNGSRYLRIATRTGHENERMVECLRESANSAAIGAMTGK